tara:strand:- start:798 stop:1013 length:216 start_codon:yes stop_codon:yes gene_type:complete
MRYGQIHVYGGHAPLGSTDIINNEDYKLKVIKTWIPATDVWHIEFRSQSINETRFEMFLTKQELQELKRVL